jgi:hypothetical protein
LPEKGNCISRSREKYLTGSTIDLVITKRNLFVKPQIFGKENSNPCTLAIVPGSVAIVYRTHYKR